MNRNKLKAYAPQARRDFIKAVTDRAAYYGLTKDKIEPVTEQGDVAIIAGKPFPRAVAAKRKRLEKRIRRQGFEQVMEAMAYTWFNRFVAIRFMELHGYLDHGYRVLSTTNDTNGRNSKSVPSAVPDVLKYAEHVDLPGVDQDEIIQLKLAGNKDEELYRMLLIAQCNALHKAMPFLFERVDDETELILPDNLLHSDSLIRKLVNEIPAGEWQEVEIIGWLYQFYISEKKDQVIGKVVRSEDIPAATQLFTPNWIVKYMVQNTLGRQWVATYPHSSLKQKMEFYIEPAEQTTEVQMQLKAITPESLNPEELSLLDPACGSGHILVEAYDLLKGIYQERGYRAKDIPRLILEKNLFGLEIDNRAAQLAAFALMMKARFDDRRIFENGTQPNVLAIQESKGLNAKELTEALNATILKTRLLPSETLFEEMEEEGTPLFSKKNLSVRGEISQPDVAHLVDLFQQGKTFGSLICVPENLAAKLPAIAERVKDVLAYGEMFGQAAGKAITPLIKQANIMTRKYGIVVTNPPYMGTKFLNPILKAFLKDHFRGYDNDLYSAFVVRNKDFGQKYSRLGFMSPFTWMFIATHEPLRSMLLDSATLDTLIQLEYSGFAEATVPICTFTFCESRIVGYRGSYVRLSNFRGAEKQAPKALEAIHHPDCGWYHIAMPDDFSKIPGKPIAYWISDALRDIFSSFDLLGELASPRSGMTTGNNAKFIRLWFEVPFSHIGFGFSSEEEASHSDYRWYPYNKGGDFRKWYGNNEYVVNWYKAGTDIIQHGRAYPRSRSLYFKPGVTWTDVSSACFGVRGFDKGFLFDASGPSLFCEEPKLILAFLASNVAFNLLKFLNPTLHFQAGNIASLPIAIYNEDPRALDVKRVVDQCVELAKMDWDEAERSWDYQGNALCWGRSERTTVCKSLEQVRAVRKSRIARMMALEQQNNSTFIEAYGLQAEFTPEVAEHEITLLKPSREEDIKCLVSYAIGCMVGRYSLDRPGLIYAHSGGHGFDPNQHKTFPADQDGIIPITDIDWFEDDASNRIIEFVGIVWPKEHLEENLRFLTESLGPKQSESPRETIRRYLFLGFYKHHLAMYKKRPIYWLFSSGKLRAFHCLVYLHRYNEGTLSRMRTEYVIPLQGKIGARIDHLEADSKAATSTSHRKKLEREQDKLVKHQAELQTFDEKLRHYADQRISLDLDDGVKVNYGKFGDLLAEVKAVTGKKAD